MDIDIGRVTRPKEAHRYGYNVEYCSFAEVVSALAPVSTDQISAIVYARTTSEQREKWIDAFKVSPECVVRGINIDVGP